MQGEDDTRALSKIVNFLAGIEVMMLLFHLYFSCYQTLVYFGLYHPLIDRFLFKFSLQSGMFSYSILDKGIILFILLLRTWASKVVKNLALTKPQVICYCLLGLFLYFAGSYFVVTSIMGQAIYLVSVVIGYLLCIRSFNLVKRLVVISLFKDVFNDQNESFMQNTAYVSNAYSVHLRSVFQYKGNQYQGWINVVNPFRGTLVLGTPGSGKTYSIIQQFITQHIAKGFCMFIYDFKYDDLSTLAYNALHHYQKAYCSKVKFYVINFDQPTTSHRCNPINPIYLNDISDAYEAAQTIFLNLNRSWIHKQGDFFVESPIVLFSAVIWYLRLYQDGRYCTLPHAIELLNIPYAELFLLLSQQPSLQSYLSSFTDALANGAQEQLQGQLASAKIALSRLSSPVLYWIMSGDDFTLDINNPLAPKVVCVANNVARQNIYSAALSLYNTRVLRVINRKNQLPCSIIVDELPTVYFKGLDHLINTARSNKIAVVLGMQDFSQLQRDYGEKESKVIQNTVGNIFSGQVLGDTASLLQERFGRILQQKQSISFNVEGQSSSISTNLDFLIPKAKISQLSQGVFVGSVSDDFGQKIKQKIFHAQIKVQPKDKGYFHKGTYEIPQIRDFGSSTGKTEEKQYLEENFLNIKNEISVLVHQQKNL